MSRTSMLLPCDFCSTKTAVLYCRADSAKLCLFCDQQVHSANALSSKHLRSPICDNCKAEPVSVRCLTDNLLLCQDCDHDSHNNNNNSSVSSLHECNPVEGFSGCPSAIDLAYVLGFDLKADNLMDLSYGSCIHDHDTVNFQDFTVPEGNSSVSPVFLIFEREKQEVYEQLVEMGKRDVVRVSGNGAELGPGTPPSGCGKQGNLESLEVKNGDNEELMHQQMPFTSLLSDSVAEGGLMWDCNPAYEAAQIWDFQLGRARDCEEPGPLETRSSANNFDLMIKTCSGLTKETSMTTSTKVLQSIYKMNCSSVCEDNLSNSNHSNHPLSSNATTTEESNTIPVIGSLPESRNVLVMEQPLLSMRETSRGAKPMVDLEMLAQNRGNAMLRYKEKKKNRRFDKHIRYESRKARADTRKRVKGRFVKASESPDVKI